jgi:hypothetical protein
VTPAEDSPGGRIAEAMLTGGRILRGRIANSPTRSREEQVTPERCADDAEESVYPPGQHPSELRWCTRCRQNLPLDQFRPNPEMLSGRHCWCRPCCAEDIRRWLAENPNAVAAYNAARREGPFPKTCSVCGREWLAARRPRFGVWIVRPGTC